MGVQIKVNEDRCVGCGLCLEECIHSKRRGKTNHVDHDFKFCNQCLHCYAVCPESAIELDKVFLNKNLERDILDYDQVVYHMQQRRSTRRFKNRAIADKLLHKLLNSANYIPSGGNNQGIDITVLRNEDKKQELREEIIIYYKKMLKLSRYGFLRAILKIFGPEKVKESVNDMFFLEKMQDMNEKFKTKDLAFYNAPIVLLFHSSRLLPTAREDAVLSAYNIALTAETLGLGSCFVSMAQQVLASNDKCKNIVNINKEDNIFVVLVIGYPIADYKKVVFRENKNINFVD